MCRVNQLDFFRLLRKVLVIMLFFFRLVLLLIILFMICECRCMQMVVFRMWNWLLKFFLMCLILDFLIWWVCLFFLMLLWVKICMLMMVLFMFGGMCSELFLMFEVFLLKIVCSSFFFGVSWFLFFGVILLIRMLLVCILVLMYIMLFLFRWFSVCLEMFGMLVEIFFGFSLVLCVMQVSFLMWIVVQ